MAVTTEKYIFSELLKQAERRNVIPNKTRQARDWFRTRAEQMTGINRLDLLQQGTPATRLTPGQMYMFTYSAKHRETLPYWDAFPLIFVVSVTNTGFTGINLHYLPPLLRARLMDALYTITNNKRFDNTTKLKISYQTLKSASNLSYFKPCFKQYLNGYVKSRFVYVEPKEWDIACFLPVSSFKKASESTVWKESANAI